MELVSIIIPVYNVEKYLRRCVDSVIMQSHSRLEIILVDDGSPDSSGLICDEIGVIDNRIKIIHKKNGGLSDARNAGLEVAAGTKVCFIDSDDWVEKDYISAMLNAMNKYNCELVNCSHYIEFVNDGTIVPIRFKGDSYYSNKEQIKNGILELEDVGAFNTVWNKMYNLELLNHYEIRFIKGSEPGEDLIFNVAYFKHINSMANIMRTLYHYMRQDENSLTRKYNRDLYSKSIHFNKIQLSLYRHYGMLDSPYFDYFKKAYIYRIFTCIPNLYRQGNENNRKERVHFYKQVLLDKELRNYIKTYKVHDIHLQIFKFAVMSNSSNLMEIIYFLMLGIRNNFSGIYNSARKTLRKKQSNDLLQNN